MSLQVLIPVGNAAALVAQGHTRIEVWASEDDGLTYNEFTGPSAAAAKLTSKAASTTFRMGGKLLKFKRDGGAEQSIAFSSLIDQWTPTQVANRINEVAPGAASVSGSSVVITSTTTGRASKVEITYNDASDLGWLSGDVDRGEEVRITLLGGTLSYIFTDVAGMPTTRYKWRFSANGAEPISDFSPYTFGIPQAVGGLPLSVGVASFVGVDGRPIKGKLIVAMEDVQVIAALAVIDRLPRTYEADAAGFLQFTAPQGAKLRIAVEGTTMVRTITVPAAASFDIFDSLSDAPDPFTVQVPPPLLIRRTLP